jgi:hypothetical protein
MFCHGPFCLIPLSQMMVRLSESQQVTFLNNSIIGICAHVSLHFRLFIFSEYICCMKVSFLFCTWCWGFVVLAIKPEASGTLGKGSITEPLPQCESSYFNSCYVSSICPPERQKCTFPYRLANLLN